MSDLSSTPKPETVLRGHKDAVNCVGFLSDELLSSGSVDGVLKLWSISSRRAVTSINAHSGSSILAINTLFYSASIVTSGRDGFVRLWRMDRESSSSHTSPVLSFPTGARHFCNASCDRGYHSDPNMLLTPSAEESEISIWDLRVASKRVAVIKQDCKEQPGSGPVASKGMVFSLLLQSQHSGSNAGNSRKFICDISDQDDHNGNEVKIQSSIDVDDSKEVISSAVPRLLAGYEDGSISSFDIRMLRELHNIRPHEEPVMTMDLSPDGKCVASGGGGDKLSRVLFNTITKKIKPSSITSSMSSKQPSKSSEWARLAESSNFPSPNMNNEDSQFSSLILEKKDCLNLPSKGTSCVRYRSDGRILVSAHWDNTIRIFDTKRMKPLAVLRHHRDKVYAVDFAPSYPDSTCRPGMFATGSKDGTIALWNLFEETIK